MALTDNLETYWRLDETTGQRTDAWTNKLDLTEDGSADSTSAIMGTHLTNRQVVSVARAEAWDCHHRIGFQMQRQMWRLVIGGRRSWIWFPGRSSARRAGATIVCPATCRRDRPADVPA